MQEYNKFFFCRFSFNFSDWHSRCAFDAGTDWVRSTQAVRTFTARTAEAEAAYRAGVANAYGTAASWDGVPWWPEWACHWQADATQWRQGVGYYAYKAAQKAAA